MIDVLIKRGYLDTETHAQREGQVETEGMYKPRNHQKVEERSEIHPSLEPSGEQGPVCSLTLDFYPLALEDNKFLFPKPLTRVLCYGSPSKLTQLATKVSHKRGQPVWFHLHRDENRLNKITVKKTRTGVSLGWKCLRSRRKTAGATWLFCDYLVWVTQGMHLSKFTKRCTKDLCISLCVTCTTQKRTRNQHRTPWDDRHTQVFKAWGGQKPTIYSEMY